jgi:hypothetical protein
MTRSPERNLAHSVQARLKNAAAQGGRPFVEMLELYAAPRGSVLADLSGRRRREA